MTRHGDRIYDVLVVGAGAAGAAVSYSLRARGLDVVCVDQGNWIDRETLPKRHLDWELRGRTEWSANPNVRAWPSDYSVKSVGETEVTPMLFNGVGGSTVGFGGVYWRLLPSDFKTRTLDGFGVDWPITYEELAPYYSQNEQIVGVSGLAGDPTGPEREEYPCPPVTMGKLGQIWARGFEQLGWHWWVQDCAIATRDYGPDRSGCVGRGFCAWGCPSKSLGSVDVTYWPLALEAGVELRLDARVRQIDIDKGGRATGVSYVDVEGRDVTLKARIVVVSAGGVGTPRLLLMSKSPRFPDGLANSSGLVGKNLMHHVQARVIGLFDERVEGDRGAWGGAFASREFYETDAKHAFLRGFTLGTRRGLPPLETALRCAPWGAQHYEVMERHLNHEGVVAVMGDDEPEEVNSIELDYEGADSLGLPGVSLRYRLSENSRRLGAEGVRRAKELCLAAGAVGVADTGLSPVPAFHLMGTARMGSRPDGSVVDRDHRSHDVPNLFIVDGSSMPTGGSVNPTNTIQALALRAADRILDLRRVIETPH
ncbi:MAG: GMC family oxidoreductase [Actinomycetota bacterium]|nr:GMC family oxidoreductase [Actinomycetota bacterium]